MTGMPEDYFYKRYNKGIASRAKGKKQRALQRILILTTSKKFCEFINLLKGMAISLFAFRHGLLTKVLKEVI